MRKLSYWVCFTLLLVPATLRVIGVAYMAIGERFFVPRIIEPLYLVTSLIPSATTHYLPKGTPLVAGFAMAFLVFRRAWLLVSRKEQTPSTYSGLPLLLGYVGIGSLLVSSAVLALSVLLRAGSGVPAGLLMIPAAICIPWAFFITEAKSVTRSLSSMRRRANADA